MRESLRQHVCENTTFHQAVVVNPTCRRSRPALFNRSPSYQVGRRRCRGHPRSPRGWWTRVLGHHPAGQSGNYAPGRGVHPLGSEERQEDLRLTIGGEGIIERASKGSTKIDMVIFQAKTRHFLFAGGADKVDLPGSRLIPREGAGCRPSTCFSSLARLIVSRTLMRSYLLQLDSSRLRACRSGGRYDAGAPMKVDELRRHHRGRRPRPDPRLHLHARPQRPEDTAVFVVGADIAVASAAHRGGEGDVQALPRCPPCSIRTARYDGGRGRGGDGAAAGGDVRGKRVLIVAGPAVGIRAAGLFAKRGDVL